MNLSLLYFPLLSAGYMALYGAALVDIVGLDNIEVTSGTLMCSKGAANLMLHMMSGRIVYIFSLTIVKYTRIQSVCFKKEQFMCTIDHL